MKPQVQSLLRFIAANAYRARHDLGLTQEQVASKAGMEVSFYQRVERAKTNLSLVALVGISNALGVDLLALFAPAEMHKLPSRGRPLTVKKKKKTSR